MLLLYLVWWHVGHEGVDRPWHSVSVNRVCYVSVYDTDGIAAAGTSQNVTGNAFYNVICITLTKSYSSGQELCCREAQH